MDTTKDIQQKQESQIVPNPGSHNNADEKQQSEELEKEVRTTKNLNVVTENSDDEGANYCVWDIERNTLDSANSNYNITNDGNENAQSYDDDDDEDDVCAVSSVQELQRPNIVIQLEGSHTGATTTESQECIEQKTGKHVSFESVVEELPAVPSLSTSKVVENVKEYVKQIETQQLDAPNEKALVPSAAQIVEQPKETLRLVDCVTVFQAGAVSGEPKTNNSTAHNQTTVTAAESITTSEAFLNDVERMAQEEVERIVAEQVDPMGEPSSECTDIKQVERENEEIAERFKQIMEMFDNFTKNLESLEMPTLPDEVTASPRGMPARRRLSFKGARSGVTGTSATDAASGAAGGNVGNSHVYNEFYLEVHGDRGILDKSETAAATCCCAALRSGTIKTPLVTSESSENSASKTETLVKPKCRDIATTMSDLKLPQAPMSPCEISNQSTIACQTAQTGIFISSTLSTQKEQCATPSPILTPNVSAVETLSLNLLSATASCSTTANKVQDTVAVVEAAIREIDMATASVNFSETYVANEAVAAAATATTATTAAAAAVATAAVGDGITIVEPKTEHTEDASSLVKIREPPTIIDLTQDVSAPRVTTVITEAGGGATTGTAVGSAPCERTFHTIHIEATSSPSSSVMRRPPLCSRLWNVITDFCAAVCLCLQVNKDCLFCLGFFIAFVVSASFLTAFFYRTLSINPQLFQVPQATPGNLGQNSVGPQNFKRDNMM